jgi:hypothetical protein
MTAFHMLILQVGAHDGETYSNTLTLEKYYNWTGVLIEPSQFAFGKLLAKHRKAYALNVCVCVVYCV